MRRMIMYRYDSWTESCGCCSNNSSTYDLYENGILVSEDNWCDLCADEDELREFLKHLEPFDINSNCEWF